MRLVEPVPTQSNEDHHQSLPPMEFVTRLIAQSMQFGPSKNPGWNPGPESGHHSLRQRPFDSFPAHPTRCGFENPSPRQRKEEVAMYGPRNTTQYESCK